MRLPLVRAIYPSVKQVTDFLLADRTARGGQFQASRVVAVQARHQGVWSIGLVTTTGGYSTWVVVKVLPLLKTSMPPVAVTSALLDTEVAEVGNADFGHSHDSS